MYWKVGVKVDDQTAKSYWAYGNSQIMYHLNQSVKTPDWLANRNLYPFVFETLHQLVDFVGHSYNPALLVVMACDCSDEVIDPVYYDMDFLAKSRVKEPLNNWPSRFPFGTRSFRNIFIKDFCTLEEVAGYIGWRIGWVDKYSGMSSILYRHTSSISLDPLEPAGRCIKVIYDGSRNNSYVETIRIG